MMSRSQPAVPSGPDRPEPTRTPPPLAVCVRVMKELASSGLGVFSFFFFLGGGWVLFRLLLSPQKKISLT